jgi:lysyl-tRNA synthetase class 2
MHKSLDINKILIREQVVDGLRAWLKKEGFREVDTPLLLPIPTTEPYYDLMATKIKIYGEREREAYLAPSPELQMKQIVAAGLTRIFQIGKVMRNNEGRSKLHNSEFTMLEFYREGNYLDIMEDLEKIYADLKKEKVVFKKISVVEAFEKYAGVAENDLLDEKKLLKKASEKGYQISEQTTYEEVFNQILANEIEGHLGKEQPTFLYNYPASQAALAKLCDDDQRLAERAELWINGIEIANIYSELIDADEQQKRIEAEIKECQKRGKAEIKEWDRDFVESLRKINKPLAGVAVGVDRLAMLIAGAEDIAEISWFPTKELFN